MEVTGLTIGMDIDDKGKPFLSGLVPYLNKRLGRTVSLTDITDYELSVFGLDAGSLRPLIFDYYETEEFRRMPWHEGFRDFMVRMKEAGCKTHFITGRPSFLEELTKKDVEENLSGLYESVNLTNQYNNSGLKRTKQDICVQRGVDVMGEDSGENAVAIAKVGVKVIMPKFTWSMNGYRGIPGITHIDLVGPGHNPRPDYVAMGDLILSGALFYQ